LGSIADALPVQVKFSHEYDDYPIPDFATFSSSFSSQSDKFACLRITSEPLP